MENKEVFLSTQENNESFLDSCEEVLTSISTGGLNIIGDFFDINERFKNAELLKIIDWDTIEVLYNWKKEKIRMIWIDTPEVYKTRKSNYLRECFWEEASAYLKKLIYWKKIKLEFDDSQSTRWKYWRLLAYVRRDWENINLKMIEDWYAYEYTYQKDNPYKYQFEFECAQLRAEIANRGLWHPNACNWERIKQ